MRATIFLIAIISLAGTGSAQQSVMQGLRTDKPSYGLGETVSFEYAIRNDTNQVLKYSFTSGKQFDLWVLCDGGECYRLSKHMFYTQALTSLTLGPGDTKTYCARWDQKDNSGKQVGPGTFTVYAQLTPSDNAPPATSTRVQIGTKTAALVPVTIKQAITTFDALAGKMVVISAVYRGFQPNPKDSNVHDGPPETNQDWAVCDDTRCMYVVGKNPLDSTKDRGVAITVIGKLKKSAKGQVYMILQSATTGRR